MIFSSLKKQSIHTNRNNWARLLRYIHTARNCRTSCVGIISLSLFLFNCGKRSVLWQWKKRRPNYQWFLMYTIRKIQRLWINKAQHNPVQQCIDAVLISGACFVLWNLRCYNEKKNITFPFCWVWVFVCWCSVTIRHLTSKIHSRQTMKEERERESKTKKNAPIKNTTLKCYECNSLFFHHPILSILWLNQHLNMGFMQNRQPNRSLSLFICYFYHRNCCLQSNCLFYVSSIIVVERCCE